MRMRMRSSENIQEFVDVDSYEAGGRNLDDRE